MGFRWSNGKRVHSNLTCSRTSHANLHQQTTVARAYGCKDITNCCVPRLCGGGEWEKISAFPTLRGSQDMRETAKTPPQQFQARYLPVLVVSQSCFSSEAVQ